MTSMTPSLFDSFPITGEAASHVTAGQAAGLRRVHSKYGPFIELVEGKPSGREFSLVETEDGRIWKDFADGGREPYPSCTREYVEQQVTKGLWVEVSA